MDYIVNGIIRIKSKLTINQKIAFFSAIIAGFLAHGYGMANNYIYHDATILDGLGITFGIGRWALGLFGFLNDQVLGNFNLPFINVVISLFFIALSATIVTKILNVNSKFVAAFIGSLMSVYPVVTSSFAYNFTATYYFFALFLVCMVAMIMTKAVHDTTGLSYIDKKIASKNKKIIIKALVVSVLLIAVSAGLYQAYLSVLATLFVALLMVDLYKKKEPAIVVFARGVIYVLALMIGLVCYLVINKVAVIIAKPPMIDYQGADDFGKLSIAKIPGRLIQAYIHFFYIKWNGINVSKGMWALVILAIALLAIIVIKNLFISKIDLSSKVLFVILAGVLPIAVNLVYLMSTSESYSVHTLMRYATAFVFIILAVLSEDDRNIITNIGEIVLASVVICYIFADNVAYLKMNLVQEEMNSYFTTLQTRITSCEGFKDDMPIVYDGEFRISDKNLTKLSDTYPEIQFLGYEYNAGDLINKESWKRYMRIHTGFEPTEGELTGDILDSDEYKSMNVYPNSDSVKMINGRVVVKLAE